MASQKLKEVARGESYTDFRAAILSDLPLSQYCMSKRENPGYFDILYPPPLHSSALVKL